MSTRFSVLTTLVAITFVSLFVSIHSAVAESNLAVNSSPSYGLEAGTLKHGLVTVGQGASICRTLQQ